jgi:hypothetical protein
VIEVTDAGDVRRILAPENFASCGHEDHGTHPKTVIIRALPYLWSSDRRGL